MRYIIIGLGNFGRALAHELTEAHYEVIGIDADAVRVDALKESVKSVFQLDATDRSALSFVTIEKNDVVVVALGKDFGTSIKITALLKSMSIQHIYVRAIDELHEAVLQGIGIENILNPEEESSRLFTQSASFIGQTELMKVDSEHAIIKMVVPDKLSGKSIDSLGIDKYSLKILLLSRMVETKNILGLTVRREQVEPIITGSTTVDKGDRIFIFGEIDNIHLYWKMIG